MLNLAKPTDPGWISRALVGLDEVLIDHAHCEKKAASTAVSLLFRYPERRALLEPLSQLAREELEHFELVLSHLDRLGIKFYRQLPSPYAGELMKAIRPNEPERAVDVLLCLSLIEARSCERMKLLADALEEPALKELYTGLLASEARHHQTYVDLARVIEPDIEIRGRLRELAEYEAEVLAASPEMPRMHA
ncbi:MAG: tRNA-(ms[2]io[6]A)-hydroxylase [Candidatus Binatia bacterium]|nr:tRNA-(ms[2]io[6]A)-hydroxylase [Candidatus Binatia bacterium]